MSGVSRRGFGVSVLSLLSAGCLARGDTESRDTPSQASPRRPSSEASTADGQPAQVPATDTQTETPTERPTDDAEIQVESPTATEPAPEAFRSVDIRFRLEENEYEAFRLDLPKRARITYDVIVRRGPAIDVLLFSAEEYRSFQRRYRARHLSEVGTFHTTNVAGKSVTVPAGEFYFVVNNTDWSRAVPDPSAPYDRIDGECIVDFEFEGRSVDGGSS